MSIPSLKTFAADTVLNEVRKGNIQLPLKENESMPNELYDFIFNVHKNCKEKNLIFIEKLNSLNSLDFDSPHLVSRLDDPKDNLRLELIKIGIINKSINLETDKNKLLFAASYNGNVKTVKFLIKNGADVTVVDDLGRNALMMAAENGHKDVVKYLIENGANINAVDSFGSNALKIAAEKGHKDVVKYLTENGANINAVDNFGCNALMFAAKEGHKDVVKYLTENGANINAVDSFGSNALKIAAYRGHFDVVKYLTENGANINAVDIDRCSALMMAAMGGHKDVVKYLKEKGANINAIDIWGNNALIHASYSYITHNSVHLETVKYLTENGLEINLTNWLILSLTIPIFNNKLINLKISSYLFNKNNGIRKSVFNIGAFFLAVFLADYCFSKFMNNK